MKNEVSDRVFQKINRENCQMKPRIYFIMVSAWWLFCGFIFFVALVSSMFLFYFLFKQLKTFFVIYNNPTHFLAYFPLFILFLILLFCILVFWFYRHSRSCCRHENWILFLFILLGAFILNLFFLKNQMIKNSLLLIEKSNRDLGIIKYEDYWERPLKGTLSGNVTFYYPKQQKVLIVNTKGEEWQINSTECRNEFLINKNNLIKIIGEKTGEYVFNAYYIWN